MIAYSVKQDTATPDIQALLAKLAKPARLHRVMAESVITRLEAHFAERAMEPNKRNWPTRRTWMKIRDATGLARANNDGATVAISSAAMRQKYYGSEVLGPITPKEGTRLALPATAAAYAAGSPREGKTPALKVMLAYNSEINHWMWALVNAEDQAGMKQVKDRRKGRQGEMRLVRDPKSPAGVWYWLARKTFVPRDPNALPSEDVLKAHALAGAQMFFQERPQ